MKILDDKSFHKINWYSLLTAKRNNSQESKFEVLERGKEYKSKKWFTWFFNTEVPQDSSLGPLSFSLTSPCSLIHNHDISYLLYADYPSNYISSPHFPSESSWLCKASKILSISKTRLNNLPPFYFRSSWTLSELYHHPSSCYPET